MKKGKSLYKSSGNRQVSRHEKLVEKLTAKLKLIKEKHKEKASKHKFVEESLYVHQVELEQQNEELRNTQQKLEESRDKYASLYDFAPIGYFTFDKNAVILGINLTGSQLLGVERRSLLGNPFLRYVFQSYRDDYRLFLKRIFETNKRQTIETRLMIKERDPFYAALEGIAIRDINGKLSRCFVAVSDISERKKAEKALRDNTSLMHAITEGTTDAIFIKDIRGRYLMINPAGAGMLGMRPEEMIGKDDRELFPQQDVRHIIETDLQVINSEKPHTLDETLTFNGKKTTLHAVKVPYRNDQGNIVGIIGIARDISERKQMEDQTQKQTTELHRSNDELEQFASVASHDLKEPLRVVTNYLELLARKYEKQLDPDTVQYIAGSVNAAERMHSLINDLLSYSKLGEKGRNYEWVDINSVVKDVLGDLKAALKETHAVVTCGRLPTMWVVRQDMVQVFQNLIGNAIKYKGKNPSLVHIAAKQDDNDETVFSVQDNGIGIESQYFERIFKIFQRLHSRQEYLGTGIGLAICKKIIDLSSGRIWVHSELGKGSTFYFTLPTVDRGSFN